MSKARAKGTNWETQTLRWLHLLGYTDAHRTGSADYGLGDIYIPSLKVAVECKNVARVDWASILLQCRGIRERNPHLVGVVACVKKRGSTSPADAYWVCDGLNAASLIAGIRA